MKLFTLISFCGILVISACSSISQNNQQSSSMEPQEKTRKETPVGETIAPSHCVTTLQLDSLGTVSEGSQSFNIFCTVKAIHGRGFQFHARIAESRKVVVRVANKKSVLWERAQNLSVGETLKATIMGEQIMDESWKLTLVDFTIDKQ
jgi:hypothetical protein